MNLCTRCPAPRWIHPTLGELTLCETHTREVSTTDKKQAQSPRVTEEGLLLSVRLPPSLAAQLVDVANEVGRRPDDLLGVAVVEYLTREHKEPAPTIIVSADRVQMYLNPITKGWYCPSHQPIGSKPKFVRRSHARCVSCNRAFIRGTPKDPLADTLGLHASDIRRAIADKGLSPDAQRRIHLTSKVADQSRKIALYLSNLPDSTFTGSQSALASVLGIRKESALSAIRKMQNSGQLTITTRPQRITLRCSVEDGL